MAKIIIGQEYKTEFESICDLWQGGFLSDAVNIKSATEKRIVTNADTFEYDNDAHGVNGLSDGASESGYKFGKGGASWFSQLRGEPFDSSNADWEQLIADVAADYHKYYALIEFKQSVEDRLSTDGGNLGSIVKRFNNGFIKRAFDRTFAVSESYAVVPEDFYAVSMRLEINGGAESEPILGKVYFRKNQSGKYVALTAAAAHDIDEFISGAVPSDEKSAQKHNEPIDKQLVSKVLGEAQALFAREDCADYIMYDGDYDKKISKMIERLAVNDQKELECTHVKVLGISHVEWQNFAYSLFDGGKKVLKLIIGLNNAVSLLCTACDKDGVALVDNNVVLFDDPDNNIALDMSLGGFGLSDDCVQRIKREASLAAHLYTVSCPNNPRNKNCAQTICAAQGVEHVTADGKKLRKCKGCPYPEIVYDDLFGRAGAESKLTESLNLDEYELRLTENSTVRCGCCGRFYQKSQGRGGLCPLCGNVEYTDSGKKLYKKYSKMLGIGVRMTHFFPKKCCKEDSNLIIFDLGRSRYVFDKLSAKDRGYIAQPKGQGVSE